MGPTHDDKWLERAGYSVVTDEVETGVYAVTLTHTRNPAISYADYARGVSPALAVKHARQRLEESLAADRPLNRTGTWPVTIFATRYNGGYEGGRWAALPLAPEEVPDDALGEDIECREWWENPSVAVGLGATPNGALAALDVVIEECEHPDDRQRPVPAGRVCTFCQQLRPT